MNIDKISPYRISPNKFQQRNIPRRSPTFQSCATNTITRTVAEQQIVNKSIAAIVAALSSAAAIKAISEIKAHENINIQSNTNIITANSDIIKTSKVSMISKPNKIEAIVLNTETDTKELESLGFKKINGEWHASNTDWFPDEYTNNDIVIIYERNKNGEPTNVGFCSKDEFSKLYTNSDKYENNIIEYIDAHSIPKKQYIKATKCASGEVCILPIGTLLSTEQGLVEIKPGEVAIINEAKNSIYATTVDEILKRYKNDPLNPASFGFFELLNEYKLNTINAPEIEKIYAHEKMSDSFSRLNKGVALCNIIGEDSIRTTPLTLRDEFNLSAKIVENLEEKYCSKIDVSNFDKAIEQAKELLLEIKRDSSLSEIQKQAAITAIIVKLLPKTNSHQHLKGSVPQDVTIEIAKEKGYSQKEIEAIKNSYSKGSLGYDNLKEFNLNYGTIGRPIKTPKDYEKAIKGIIEEAAKQGQIAVEIRCAVDSLRDDNGILLSANEGARSIIQSIEKAKSEIVAKGLEAPKTGFVFLTYRGRDWESSLSDAVNQAIEAKKTAIAFPNLKFGIDIAGPEDTGYPPSAFKDSLDIIKQHNKDVEEGLVKAEKIGITIHAGETPTYNNGIPGNLAVEEALELGADRIGHGVQAVLSEDTMDKLKKSGATVEICGVCNIQSIPINAQGHEKHPIEHFIRNEIPVTICTDNDAICGTNITKEYLQFLLTGHSGMMNWNNIKQTARQGLESAFLSKSDKKEAFKIMEERINKIQKLYEEIFVEK